MIIGIDARELEGKMTGVGVYLREVLKRVQLPPNSQLLLFFRTGIPEAAAGLPGSHVVLSRGKSNFLWQQWILSRAASARGVQFLFSPGYSLPWHFHGRQAVTVHDISFFRRPEWFSVKERIARQLATSISIRQADRIYTVSDYVKGEIVERFRIPADRIAVTPNGVSVKATDPNRREQMRADHAYTNDKIVLYVGSIFNRRRLPVLIEALKHLGPQYRLIVIGENRTYPRVDLAAEARRHGVEQRIEFLGFAPDEVVEQYYRMADVLVYLSEYEGFGIPPLEAMSYGVPAVISAAPAMNTLFQNSAAMVDQPDAPTLAQTIERILSDPNESERMVRTGRELADRYTWDNTARILSQDWEQILAACR